MKYSQHTQNIQISNVIGKNEKCVIFLSRENHIDFLAEYYPFYTDLDSNC